MRPRPGWSSVSPKTARRPLARAAMRPNTWISVVARSVLQPTATRAGGSMRSTSTQAFCALIRLTSMRVGGPRDDAPLMLERAP
jgi:hypothetical protein